MFLLKERKNGRANEMMPIKNCMKRTELCLSLSGGKLSFLGFRGTPPCFPHLGQIRYLTLSMVLLSYS